MLTLNDIIQITATTENTLKSLDLSVTGFSIDSRTIQPNNVFVALQGENSHGNEFAAKAIEQGASAVLTDIPLDDPTLPMILVPDSLQALNKIAAYQRQRFKGKVCAVTGTVGKTSVKDALKFLTSQLGLNVHASEKSYNNHIGVPLTLANLSPNADIAIIEIGMNHPGEILPLTQLSSPHVAIVTMVGPGHIEFFDSVQDIALEKVSIAAGLYKGGAAILPKDSEFFDCMAQFVEEHGYSYLSFGVSDKADSQALTIKMVNINKLHVTARIAGINLTYDLPTSNYGWVNNSLAILTALYLLGLDIKLAAEKLYLLPLGEGRGKVYSLTVHHKNITLIDDAYNANPLSMTAALETLSRYPGRKMAIMGDMRELGKFAEPYHVEMGQLCNRLNIDKVLTCGESMKNAFNQLDKSRQLTHVDTYNHVLPILLEALQDGDVVLIKASNGVKLHQTVKLLLAQ